MNEIICGDCLDVMRGMGDNEVDMILCDLPYGTTACIWDTIIPFEPLWKQYKRIIKENGAIVLFGSEPFSSRLRMSNIKDYKYDLVWVKTCKTGFYNAKRAPLRKHEMISIFYTKQPTYNPQMNTTKRKDIGRRRGNSGNMPSAKPSNWGKASLKTAESYRWVETGLRYPDDVLEFPNWNGALFGDNTNATKHPTQKPVALFEYLIRTYTNEGDVVLDNCIGSGTTAIACINTGRNFIGIEKDPEYFRMAQDRINKVKPQQKLFSFIKEEVTA